MPRWSRLLAVAAVLLALAGYEHWLGPGRTERRLPTGPAEWIWADAETGRGSGYSAGPGLGFRWTSFFVYKDFDLEGDVPEKARLLIQADEVYWVFVNGKAVGSGVYGTGGAMDAYEVASFLRAGANRVLVQLRSRRGVGGLLAAIDLGESGLVTTDGSWRSSSRYESAMQTAGFVPEDEREVRVWGPPPIGSWDVPGEPAAVPLLADQILSGRARGPMRVRFLGHKEWERRFPEPGRRIPLGRWIIFDMGEPAQGYVNVVFAARGGAQGLIYTGLERIAGPDNAEPATWFRAPPGRGSWSDFEPRRFRFLAVLSDADIAGLRVFETGDERLAGRGAGLPRSERALGLEPPPSGSTVEDEFWRELERVTGIAGREALESFPGG